MRKISFILPIILLMIALFGCAGNKYHNSGPMFIGEGGVQTRVQDVRDTSTAWLNPKPISLEVFRANPLYKMAENLPPSSSAIPHKRTGEYIEYFMGDKLQYIALGDNPLAAKRKAKAKLRGYFHLNPKATLLGFREIACQPSTKTSGWVSYCEVPIKINRQQAKEQYKLPR